MLEVLCKTTRPGGINKILPDRSGLEEFKHFNPIYHIFTIEMEKYVFLCANLKYKFSTCCKESIILGMAILWAVTLLFAYSTAIRGKW